LRELIEHQPVLVQISAAKRLRDQAERVARDAGLAEVHESHVQAAGLSLGLGVPA
jgi:chlorophyllide a reductase subunit Z